MTRPVNDSPADKAYTKSREVRKLFLYQGEIQNRGLAHPFFGDKNSAELALRQVPTGWHLSGHRLGSPVVLRFLREGIHELGLAVPGDAGHTATPACTEKLTSLISGCRGSPERTVVDLALPRWQWRYGFLADSTRRPIIFSASDWAVSSAGLQSSTRLPLRRMVAWSQ